MNASDNFDSSPSLQVAIILKSFPKFISFLFSLVYVFWISSFKVIFLFPVRHSFNLSKFSVLTSAIFFKINDFFLITADNKIPG